MNPALRPCGNPDCRICQWRDEEHQDSGHSVEEPSESLAMALLGTAAIILLAAVAFLLLPVLA